MAHNFILYQEKVEMPTPEIGINTFYYNCINAPSTGVFSLHWHHCMELIAVQSGWLEIEVDRKAWRIEAGDICVINPSQLHCCAVFEPNTTLYCLIINMDLFRSRYLDAVEERYISPLTENLVLFPNRISGNEELNALICRCCDVFSARKEAYPLQLKSLLFGILHLLFTQSGGAQRNEQVQSSSLARERVNKILQFVEDHYSERIKLDDLVQILHINKYYICKIFQQYIGKTFLDYVNLVRIQKAVDMIVSTNDSITAIAFATGFQDINYFSRMFKRVMGISPTELRKRHRA